MKTISPWTALGHNTPLEVAMHPLTSLKNRISDPRPTPGTREYRQWLKSEVAIVELLLEKGAVMDV